MLAAPPIPKTLVSTPNPPPVPATDRGRDDKGNPLTAKLCVELSLEALHLVVDVVLLGLEGVLLGPELVEAGLELFEDGRGGEMKEGGVEFVPAEVR